MLADEMGLGKTIQVIALLEERCSRGLGPSLVVVPVTLIETGGVSCIALHQICE